MSFDKTYPNRKDHRKPYHGSRSFDRSCRNHGGCGWCEGNRTIQSKRLDEVIRDEFDDIEDTDEPN